MRALLLSIAALLGLAMPSYAAETIAGRAQVVDGDTIAIDGTKAHIRLYGIDTPEKKQTCDDAAGKRYLCGSRAAAYLAELIGRNGQVKCFEEDRDRYGRIVAECSTSDNKTVLNAAMVKAGWAVEYKQYSDGRYDQEEVEAKREKRGLWAGQFVVPANWRRGERLPSEDGKAVTPADTRTTSAAGGKDGCRIKGNISSSGKIYHLPGGRSYDDTRIDESKGERWFCSEGDARAAGWRAARG